jgi:hypothetical protein
MPLTLRGKYFSHEIILLLATTNLNYLMLLIFLYLFCQFTIYLTLMEVISKCDICLCLADGNCPGAALIHLIF